MPTVGEIARRRRERRRSSFPAALALGLLLGGAAAWAGDWPQLLGPLRDGHAAPDERLPERFPAGELAPIWTARLGDGYAGPVVAGERVVAFHRVDDVERVEAWDAATGRRLWQADFPARYRGGIDADRGPRATPVIAGQTVYVYGAAGELHAVNLADGAHRWSRSLAADYDAGDGYFGAGSTPLVVGDKVLINVGGRAGASIVAVAAETGRTLWKTLDDEASYSSPTLATLADRQVALVVTRLHLLAIDPATGKHLATTTFGRRGPTVNAATPLAVDGRVFVTASYGIGARLVQLAGQELADVWAGDDQLSSQYNTPVMKNGYLYGVHGREDGPAAELRCVEAATGRVAWSVAEFGVAHLIAAGDRILAVDGEGRLVLFVAQPQKFTSLAEGRPLAGSVRAAPALAGGRLYYRTSGVGGRLVCLDLAADGR